MTEPASHGLSAEDVKHLRLLSLFHYGIGALQALISLLPLIHFAMGAFLFFAPESLCPAGSDPSKCIPPFFGLFFMGFAALFIAIGLTLAVSMIANGRFIARRRRWLACIIISALECSVFPFGTILGIFALIVLSQPNIKLAFQDPDRTSA